MNSFQYKGRKAGQHHVVPSAPFSFNDGGRQSSKRPRQKNDCTVRAIAIACSIPYDSAYDLLKANGRRERTAFPAIKGYLRMYPGDFCKLFPRGRWIIKTAKHVSAVVDGTIHDTFRPDPFRCAYGA